MEVAGVLNYLLHGQTLGEAEAEAVFCELLEGRMNDPQIAAVLTLIACRGPTVDELVGGARAMRRFVTPVPAAAEQPGMLGPIIDTCGTGGAPKTFNISTAAAIVTAAAAGPSRVRVAKHGNRSRSGRGSAEVLAALGVNVDASPAVQARCLDEVGVCFCFAIHAHPAMKHAATVRRALGFPTIFNLLGPLTNPARATRQVIGVYGREEAEKVAHALARLGADRAMVVHGFDGMDEITTRDRTHVFAVQDGRVYMSAFDAQDAGVARAPAGALEAADLDHSVSMVRGVIEGDDDESLEHPRRIVTLNAGAALMVAGVVAGIVDGMQMAGEAIDCGGAARKLQQLVDASMR
ncbi:MAG: anthranilate phosphoribosyltransferase [Phycisphaerales bacterium]|nr:anthranilate phosphoribosyltransferase [Phycisphaerales bacterium]